MDDDFAEFGGGMGDDQGGGGFDDGYIGPNDRPEGSGPMTDFEAVFEGAKGKDGEDKEDGPSLSASQRTSTNGRSSSQIGTGWSLRSVKMLKFLQAQMPKD